MRKLRGQAHWLCQSPGGLPPLRQARPAPAQRNQASESILDAGQGRQCRFHRSGWRPLRRLAPPILLSPPRSPQKNEPPMGGSSALSEFVPKTKGSRFGAMILDAGQGARKSRGRSVLLVREGAAYSEATQPRAKSIRQIRRGRTHFQMPRPRRICVRRIRSRMIFRRRGSAFLCTRGAPDPYRPGGA